MWFLKLDCDLSDVLDFFDWVAVQDAMKNSTLVQRDFVPLQLTFTLKQGLLRLSADDKAVLELECANMVQQWESRPRLRSAFLVHVSGKRPFLALIRMLCVSNDLEFILKGTLETVLNMGR